MAIFVIAAHLLGALTSVRALMTTRTPQGTIAWVISLNTFPYVAVPAYWIFGSSRFESYVAARRDDEDSVSGEKKIIVEEFRKQNVVPNAAKERNQFLTKLVGVPPTNGNRAELLVDGKATFDSIFTRNTVLRAETITSSALRALERSLRPTSPPALREG